jgi:hypothetical protein
LLAAEDLVADLPVTAQQFLVGSGEGPLAPAADAVFDRREEGVVVGLR